jgi:hypothetical protein
LTLAIIATSSARFNCEGPAQLIAGCSSRARDQLNRGMKSLKQRD